MSGTWFGIKPYSAESDSVSTWPRRRADAVGSAMLLESLRLRQTRSLSSINTGGSGANVDIEMSPDPDMPRLDLHVLPRVRRADREDGSQLRQRHIHMLGLGFRSYAYQVNAEGAALGSGLFLKSGEVLATSGAVSLLLGYLAMGTVVYAVMVLAILRIS